MTFSGITKNQQQQQHQPVAPQVLEDEEEEEEEVDDGLPLWKKALMKKRKEEQKKKNQELKQKVVKMCWATSRYDELHWSAELIRDCLQAKHCVAKLIYIKMSYDALSIMMLEI